MSWTGTVIGGPGSSSAPPSYPTSALAIPGSTILGYYPSGGAYSTFTSAETTFSHTFKAERFYCDFSNNTQGKPGITGSQPRLAANAGVTCVIRIDPVIFSGNTSQTAITTPPQPAGSGTNPYGHPWWGFDDVLAGNCDAAIAQLATNLQLLPNGPHIIDFATEPDLAGRRIKAKLAPSLYAAACRYFFNGLKSNGYTNFEPAWIMAATQSSPLNLSSTVTISSGAADSDSSSSLGNMFNTYYGIGTSGGTLDNDVIWVGNEPYWTSNSETATKFIDFWNHVQNGTLLPGTVASSKPFVLGEWGIGTGVSSRPTAFGTCAGVMTPDLQMALYFDSTGTLNSNIIGTTDGSIAAFTTLCATANFV